METEEPLRGDALLVAVWNQIFEYPETHVQGGSRCPAKHGFLGWVQILGRVPPDRDTAVEDVQKLLGVSQSDARWLGCTFRARWELFTYTQQRITLGLDDFDCCGFNRSGYDRDGYDRDGYDRDGFDGSGFDRDGFDRDGFDRDGFDGAGFDRDGFDGAGFDRDGFDRQGYDRYGYSRSGFHRDIEKPELCRLSLDSPSDN